MSYQNQLSKVFIALKTIAEHPITDTRNMDATNMQITAKKALEEMEVILQVRQTLGASMWVDCSQSEFLSAKFDKRRVVYR
jgi:hypothetical protein